MILYKGRRSSLDLIGDPTEGASPTQSSSDTVVVVVISEFEVKREPRAEGVGGESDIGDYLTCIGLSLFVCTRACI